MLHQVDLAKGPMTECLFDAVFVKLDVAGGVGHISVRCGGVRCQESAEVRRRMASAWVRWTGLIINEKRGYSMDWQASVSKGRPRIRTTNTRRTFVHSWFIRGWRAGRAVRTGPGGINPFLIS